MSKQTNNIPINFLVYEPYNDFPQTIRLGRITQSQALETIDKFRNSRPTEKACLKSLQVNYTDIVNFESFKTYGKKHGVLNISGMFFPDYKPKCAKCKNEDLAKVKCCARNLRAGKCQDEFIRKTLGAILFPQHYGKQK
ncbi:MAG: hypothetical protein J6J82_03695 [Alphaproteobacteria bacterium]|nr:hypothetical protein [Alphaproteobacteria bacterium]